MRFSTRILAVFLLLSALAAGWFLPRGMAWFQSATMPQTASYPVQAVNLNYSRELPLLEKYSAVRLMESCGFVEAGHTASEVEMQSAAWRFLQTAFPGIDTAEALEVQPALIVSDGSVLIVWHCRYVYEPGVRLFELEFIMDDASGAVLALKLDASNSGLMPVLCMLYGLPEDYWQQVPDVAYLLQIISAQFETALEYGQEGLNVTSVENSVYAAELPRDYGEPVFFGQILLLEQQDAFINIELMAEERQMYLNCY